MPLEIVSAYSETELRLKQAASDAAGELANLTANLLRVLAGAGKPNELPEQIAATHEAMSRYMVATAGCGSVQPIAGTGLDWRDDFQWASPADRKRWLEDGSMLQHQTEEEICSYAMRVVAASLLNQKTQRNASHTALYRALNELNEIRARNRRKWR